MRGNRMSKDTSPTSMNSVLGEGSVYSGTLKVEGGLRVDGTVEGELDVQGTLTVGNDGTVKGEVRVHQGIVGGTIIGTVHAENQLELQQGSRVEGDIYTRSLIIEEGVFFEGNCRMRERSAEDRE